MKWETKCIINGGLVRVIRCIDLESVLLGFNDEAGITSFKYPEKKIPYWWFVNPLNLKE